MFHSALLAPKVSSVRVEYDSDGTRKTKEFTAVTPARRFFITKSKEGKNPRLTFVSLA